MGAKLIHKASHNSNIYAGDGTTTATLLANSILEEGIKVLQHGMSSIAIRNGVLKAKDEVINYLEEIKRTDVSEKDLFNVAMISTNGDEQLSQILAEATAKTGEHGIVHLEPSRTMDTHLIVRDRWCVARY